MASTVSRIDEFFVACNPPLLPNGVERIIKQTRDTFVFDDNPLPEILYEPEIPWFKCISYANHHAEIIDYIQKQLALLLEQETEPLDLDQDHGEVDEEVRPDIGIINTLPQVMPWALYAENTDNIQPRDYDACRFPANLVKLPYKAIWRGVEADDTWTIHSLFNAIGKVGKLALVPSSIQEFAELVGCEASYNMCGTMIYLGNDSSKEAVDKAVKILDTMFECLHDQPLRGRHLVITEGKHEYRLCHRWISTIGLSQKTFAPADSTSLQDEYDLLKEAAVLRTEGLYKGTWQHDDTTYPRPDIEKPDPAKPFKAFERYAYTLKQPSHGRMPSKVAATDSVTVENTAKSLAESANPSLALRPSPVPVSSGDMMTSLNQPPALLDTSSTIRNRVASWIEKTGDVAPVLLDSPLDQNNDLLSFEESKSRNTPLEPMQVPVDTDLSEFKNSSDLIWFENSPQINARVCQEEAGGQGPNAKFNGDKDSVGPRQVQLPGPVQDLAATDFLLDSPVPEPSVPTLLGLDSPPGWGRSLSRIYPVMGHTAHDENEDDEALAIFGITNQEPPKHIQTMNQRAGRPRGGGGGRGNRTSPAKKRPPQVNNETNPQQSPAADKSNTAGTKDADKNDTTWPALPGKQPLPNTKKDHQLSYSAVAKEITSASSMSVQPSSPSSDSLGRKVAGQQTLRSKIKAAELAPRVAPESALASQGDGLTSDHEERRNSSAPRSEKEAILLGSVRLRTKALAGVLQVTEGIVSLEIKFGRIYFKNMAASVVSNGTGPVAVIDGWLQMVADAKRWPIGRNAFSPILTTRGADAEALVNTPAPGESDWTLSRTSTVYEFTCHFENEPSGSFIVEVDAKKFVPRCRGPVEEVSSLFLHCPQRAWDLKVVATRCNSFRSSSRIYEFAENLVKTVGITTDPSGALSIEASETGHGAIIKAVRIRHTARYRNKDKGGSVLMVNMYRVVSEDLRPRRKGVVFRGNTLEADTILPSGSPSSWFEASIASVRGQELFKENLSLSFGERTVWNSTQLEDDRILEEIFQPALGMIQYMDGIGTGNDNGQGMQGMNTYSGALLFRKDVATAKEFW